jgi:hypothetical protein
MKTLTAILILIGLSACGRAEPGVEYIGIDEYTCTTYRTGDDNHLVVRCFLTPTGYIKR